MVLISNQISKNSMGIIDSLKNNSKKNSEFIDPGIGICVECGSINTERYGKYIVCKECKVIRHFRIKSSRFHPGDLVRIVETSNNSEIIYRIEKIKKSKEGTILYVLKPESGDKEVLYYEGKDAHLQMVVQSKTKKTGLKKSDN